MTDPGPPVGSPLLDGTIEVLGQIAWSSNATLLAAVIPRARSENPGDADVPTPPSEAPMRAIYKPEQGERPLGDFPPGIWRREVAAYELARALRWDCVPETVTIDGPYGVGSLQRFVEVDYNDHYFTMIEADDPSLDAQLRRLCCFDLLANNTDRKAGHCLLDADRHVWAIDNALCFHAIFKLRTVIWDFAGERIDQSLLDDIVGLLDTGLPDSLNDLLDPFERDALRTRAQATLRDGTFPYDATGRRYPWPLV